MQLVTSSRIFGSAPSTFLTHARGMVVGAAGGAARTICIANFAMRRLRCMKVFQWHAREACCWRGGALAQPDEIPICMLNRRFTL